MARRQTPYGIRHCSTVSRKKLRREYFGVPLRDCFQSEQRTGLQGLGTEKPRCPDRTSDADDTRASRRPVQAERRARVCRTIRLSRSERYPPEELRVATYHFQTKHHNQVN